MKSQIFFSSCLILMMSLVGCSEQTNSSTPEISNTNSSNSTPVANSSPEIRTIKSETINRNTRSIKRSPTQQQLAASSPSDSVSKNGLITPQGIGQAKLGMTYGELKKALGSDYQLVVKSPFIVDFDAIAISQAGKVQYYILYPAGTSLKNSDVIEALITNNPNYRTVEGIGPETPLQQAEQLYGDATLSYNTANESREYASFANQPSKNMAFRVGSAASGDQAGIYSSPTGEYNETKQYQENAKIRSVQVSCIGDACPTR